MLENSELAKTLNKVFGNKKFIQSLTENSNRFNPEIIESKLARVLCYYIATRDTNISYTYDEINRKYSEIEKINAIQNPEIYSNIFQHGFVTHSFNGYKKDRIQKYGLDYFKSVSMAERKQIKEMREALNYLEENIESSFFNSPNAKPNEVFVSTPGTKTIYYACQNSPERLFKGPLKQDEPLPIIVGESKASYYFRVLEDKFYKKFQDRSLPEYKKAIEISKKVVDYYCSKSPSFALLSIDEIKDIPVSPVIFKDDNEPLQKYIKNPTTFLVEHFFTSDSNDIVERYNTGDLATLTSYIPHSAVDGIVDMMDYFEMKQLFAKSQGLKEGDLIDFNTCEYRGQADLKHIYSIVSNMKTEEQLEELYQTFRMIREEKMQALSKSRQKVVEKFGTSNVEELQDKKKKLLEQENVILKRDYTKRKGARDTYSLADVLKKLKADGSLSMVLERDDEILSDDMQYNSDLHGVSHTRRVNFLAATIMNFKKIYGKDREIVFDIVKNHDIGRKNDLEDKEHGNKSRILLIMNENRLSNYSESDRQLIQYVVQQHSLSTSENQYNLLYDIDTNSRGRYWQILDIIKDADKLDRVRLDPYGVYLREGLNPDKLATKEAKSLESVAYEAYDKLFEILDIEKQIGQIDQFIGLTENEQLSQETETEFELQRQACQSAAQTFCGNMIECSESKVKYSRIQNLIERSKKIFDKVKSKTKFKGR